MPAFPQPSLQSGDAASSFFELVLCRQDFAPLLLDRLQRLAALFLGFLALKSQADAFIAELFLQGSDFLLALLEMSGELNFLIGQGTLSLFESAFLLDHGGYTTLDVPGSVLSQMFGINNAGQIVGYDIDAAGMAHAFLAAPVPEPSAFLLLAAGALSLIGYVWWSRRYQRI